MIEETVHLDLVDMLPIIRKAFDNKELQMFQDDDSGICLYSGPCAIGVCLDKEQQDALDNSFLFDNNNIEVYMNADMIDFKANQQIDIILLQYYHDNVITSKCVNRSIKIQEFDNLLKRLEKEYL